MEYLFIACIVVASRMNERTTERPKKGTKRRLTYNFDNEAMQSYAIYFD